MCRQLIKQFFLLFLLFPFVSTASEELDEGYWSGVLTNHLGGRYMYKLEVRYNCVLEKNGTDVIKELFISMVNLDHEYQPDFRYSLYNIKLSEKQLSFDFKTSSDIKSCVLEKEPSCEFDCKYEGKCLSDKAKNGEISYLYMKPPEVE